MKIFFRKYNIIADSWQPLKKVASSWHRNYKHIAFEFNGLFWHNDTIHKNRNYHLMKTEMCELSGIQLIHVFEDEWRQKNNIVVSRIKNLMGHYDTTVFARKCSIREVSSSEEKDFLSMNHIQGHIKSKCCYGLIYNNEVISLMSFGKSRFNRNYEWELLRFCNKLNYHIPGGASKLLTHFERVQKPKSLISYADRRWSIGTLYYALGFNLMRKSRPNYWYFKGVHTILLSRMKFQKHKLPKLLDNFDESKSEVENMRNNGYLRIFDCGNLVFVKEYNIL